MASIYTANCKGRKSRLEEHKEEIIEMFTKNSLQTRDEACTTIKEKCGIEIEKNAMGNF